MALGAMAVVSLFFGEKEARPLRCVVNEEKSKSSPAAF